MSSTAMNLMKLDEFGSVQQHLQPRHIWGSARARTGFMGAGLSYQKYVDAPMHEIQVLTPMKKGIDRGRAA